MEGVCVVDEDGETVTLAVLVSEMVGDGVTEEEADTEILGVGVFVAVGDEDDESDSDPLIDLLKVDEGVIEEETDMLVDGEGGVYGGGTSATMTAELNVQSSNPAQSSLVILEYQLS